MQVVWCFITYKLLKRKKKKKGLRNIFKMEVESEVKN